MIADWSANFVLFSDLLEGRYPTLYRELCRILDGYGVGHGVVEGTKDIWARDYCPVQRRDGSFVQFVYRPSYLRGCEHLITTLPVRPDTEVSSLLVDGGNLVGNEKVVYLTDKVFEENAHLTVATVTETLEKTLKNEVEFIPHDPFDVVCHADGLIRFLDADTLLCNEAVVPFRPHQKRLLAKLRERFKPIIVPRWWWPSLSGIPSARGNYINFLRVKNILILPAFNVSTDDKVLRFFREVAPHLYVHQVDADELSREGGVLNCVTSTIRQEKK